MTHIIPDPVYKKTIKVYTEAGFCLGVFILNFTRVGDKHYLSFEMRHCAL